MANIGSFKKSGNEFQGEIVTLSVQTKGVRIAPEVNRSNDNAPTTGSTWAGLIMRRAGLCGAIVSEAWFSALF